MAYVAGAIVFLPLIAAFLAGFLGRALGDRFAQLVTCLAVSAAAVLSIVVFDQVALQHQTATIDLMRFIDTGPLRVEWAIKLDTLTAVMLCVVTVVSAMVHIYSIGYMAHDHGKPRFMAYLSLFTFAMLALVTADNFVQLFFGWEGVGTCSYLLIGFWYDRDSANAAAIKAFIVNRIGDFGFALGIFATFVIFGSLDFDTVFQAVPAKAAETLHFLNWNPNAVTLACLLLFVGAMGKSAQIGLHTWLPDAMEGPTPVSALIHAATMVTAGVFMVCRLSPMFEYSPTALTAVTIIGATTAIFAASIGLAQNDIKRVIAYSTCSQLGYMFFAAGVSAYPAAIFHLGTHAFFKALLFLCAGSVIHAMSDEQDMRKMGGLRKKIPYTFWLMVIGSLALTGIPPLAGSYSKDAIIEAAYAAGTPAGQYGFWLGVIAAFFTSFYSWRLLFMTFFGTSRADHHTQEHVHESPAVMLLPLVVLAAGAIFAGMAFSGLLIGEGSGTFWAKSIVILSDHKALADREAVPELLKALPLTVAVLGFLLAGLFYIVSPGLPARFANAFWAFYQLVYNKWYFDEIYDFLIVKPAMLIGWGLWKGGDGAVIDGLGPDGVATVTQDVARRTSQLQTGYVYHYAFAMLIGVVLMVTYYLWRT